MKQENKEKLTHDDVVLLASKWLRRSNPIGKHYATNIVTELAFLYSEKEPDVWGLNVIGGYTVHIECKATRSDLLKDLKRIREWDLSLEWAGHFKYLAVAEDIWKDKDQVPPGWGLLLVKGKQVREVLKASTNFGIVEKVRQQDMKICGSLLRRFMQGKTMHRRGLK